MFPVPGRGYLIIRGWVENPSGVFFAMFLGLRSLRTSVLGKEVGGSGLRVKVSGAPKFRGVGLGVKVKVGNLVSMKRQLRNLAL
jgi:hypothetical protein